MLRASLAPVGYLVWVAVLGWTFLGEDGPPFIVWAVGMVLGLAAILYGPQPWRRRERTASSQDD